MKSKNFGLKDFYWFYFITLVLTPMGILIRIFYSKTLTLEEFSYIYGIINFFNLINVLINFGLHLALGYYIPKFIVEKNTQRIRNSLFYVIIFYLFQVLFFTVILYFLRNILAIHYFNDTRISTIFLIMLLFFVGNSFFAILKNIYVAFKMNTLSQGMSLVKFALIFSVSIIIFLILGSNPNLGIFFAYIWGIASILAFIFYFILFFMKNSWVWGKLTWDKQLMKMLFFKGFDMFIASIGVIIMAYTDMILITIFIGVINAGIYDTMVSLIRQLPLLLASISIILIPLFSELKSQGNFDLISRHLNMLYGFGVFVVTPIALSIFIFSNSIIKFLYSSDFLAGALVIKIFAIFGVFRVISDFNRNIMNGLGLSKKLIVITFMVAGINIIFDLLLIPIIGMEGAALVTSFGWIIYVFLTTYYIGQSVKFNFNFKRFLMIILDSIIFLFIIGILKYFIQTGNIFIDGLLVITPGLVVYTILGNWLRIITFEESLLFVPQKLRPQIEEMKNKYFQFIK